MTTLATEAIARVSQRCCRRAHHAGECLFIPSRVASRESLGECTALPPVVKERVRERVAA